MHDCAKVEQYSSWEQASAGLDQGNPELARRAAIAFLALARVACSNPLQCAHCAKRDNRYTRPLAAGRPAALRWILRIDNTLVARGR